MYVGLPRHEKINAIAKTNWNLLSLKYLDVRTCKRLEKLPSSLGSLTRLTYLDISDCVHHLHDVPRSLGNFLKILPKVGMNRNWSK
jgi:Leucine-rich repeat (LRR) protein